MRLLLDTQAIPAPLRQNMKGDRGRCNLLAPKGALYVMMCLPMIMMCLNISNFNPPQTLTIYGDIIPVVSTVNHEHHPCFNALLLSHGSSKITYSVSYTSVVPHFLRLEYFSNTEPTV